MKAGLLRAPNVLDLADVPDPTPQPGDLILKVRAATVCGTDIRIFRGRKTAGVRYPSVIGHEFAGEVVEAPVGASFTRGQRVCVDPAIPCGRCACCKRGIENICEDLTAIAMRSTAPSPNTSGCRRGRSNWATCTPSRKTSLSRRPL